MNDKIYYLSEPVIRESLEFLPKLGKFTDYVNAKKYLLENLPFNSNETRDRASMIILKRYTDKKNPSLSPIIRILSRIKDTRTMKDILFYEFVKIEKSVFFSNKEFISNKLSGFTSIELADYLKKFFKAEGTLKIANRILHALKEFDKISISKTGTVRKYYPKIRVPAPVPFAYVLHREYPEAGIHPVSELKDLFLGEILLWDLSDMDNLLKELVDKKYLDRVSGVGRYYQFVMKYNLNDFLDEIRE